MVIEQFRLEHLELIRQKLGISRPALAKRSGVSLATVQRILSGKEKAPRWPNIAALAQTMGVKLSCRVKIEDFTRQEARKKAERLVAMVQATSGLEGQGVDERARAEMVEQTMHELLAGSRQNLWSYP